MLNFTIQELVDATGATLLCGNGDQPVHAVTIDSRQVKSGSCFCAFAGERQDGNDFVMAAAQAGAACCVMSREPSHQELACAIKNHCALVRALDDDAQEFLLLLADAWRARNPHWKVLAVTGSVGKTTTKDMCYAACKAQVKTCATQGNYNNLIGMPLTLLSADSQDEVVVLEMGMNHLDEISRMSRIARPQVAIITNVGTAHIGLLGSQDNIARAKAEVLDGMKPTDVDPGSRLIMPAEDMYSLIIQAAYAMLKHVETCRVGFLGPMSVCPEDNAVNGYDMELDAEGCARFVLRYHDGETFQMHLSIPGRGSAVDCLLALGALDHLGMDRAASVEAIAALKPGRMRAEVKSAPGRPCVIDDTYNASPTSMASALDLLSTMDCKGRRIAVLGEMGEMGEKAPYLHSLVGAYAAAKPLDILCVIGGELAQDILTGARMVGLTEDEIIYVKDVDSALRVLAPVLTEDDCVLVKASRSAQLDRFVEGVLE